VVSSPGFCRIGGVCIEGGASLPCTGRALIERANLSRRRQGLRVASVLTGTGIGVETPWRALLLLLVPSLPLKGVKASSGGKCDFFRFAAAPTRRAVTSTSCWNSCPILHTPFLPLNATCKALHSYLKSRNKSDAPLVQLWWAHLLLRTCTTLARACWNQNSAFFLPSSTRYFACLVQ